MAKQPNKQFKLDAVQYYQDHKDLGVRGCAENLDIGYSTLTKWLKDFRESGDIPDNIASVKVKLRMQMEFRLGSVRVGKGEQGNEREATCLLDISNDNGDWLSIVR